MEQRDAELRARLVFRSVRDQVAIDVTRTPQTTLIPLLDRITEDERILALGFCLQSGELLFATKEMPPSLRCANLPRAKSDTFATLSEDGQRVSVASFR